MPGSKKKEGKAPPLFGNIKQLPVPEYLGIVQPEANTGPGAPDQGSASFLVTQNGIDVADFYYTWTLQPHCSFKPTPTEKDATVFFEEMGTPSATYQQESLVALKTIVDADGNNLTCAKTTNFTVVAVQIDMPEYICADTKNPTASFPLLVTVYPKNLPDGNMVSVVSAQPNRLFEDALLTTPIQAAYPAASLPRTFYHRLDIPGAAIITAKHNRSRAMDLAKCKIVQVMVAGPAVVCLQCEIQLSATGGKAPYQWTSSDTTVASVDNNGLVKGLCPGYTTITASDEYGCVGEMVVTVIKVETETESTIPADRTRKKIGIGEAVTLTLLPASATPVTWTMTGDGTFLPPSDNSITYLAPDRAATPTVAATYQGHDCTVTFTVVEPSSAYQVQKPGTGIKHMYGKASIGFKAETYLLPNDVSFYNIEVREVGGTGIGTGYYTYLNGLTHDIGSWFYVNFENKILTDDTIWSGAGDPPFSVGEFTWPIDREFRVLTGTERKYTTLTHHQIVDAVGTATIEKGGAGPFSRQTSDPTSDY